MSYLELTLLLLPPFAVIALIRLWATTRFHTAGRTELAVSGFKVSTEILAAAGAADLDVQQTPGTSSDHYDPFAKVVRLSTEVYHGRTAAAVGIAALETCHAIRHRQGSTSVLMRGVAAAFAGFGTVAGVVALLMGLVLGELVVFACGVSVINFIVVVHLLNLPVELLASRNAAQYLAESGLLDAAQRSQVDIVLRAAAYGSLAAPLQILVLPFAPLVRYLGGKD